MRSSWDSWHGFAWKREGSGGNLIIFYRYLMEGCVEDGAKLCSVVHNKDKVRANGHKQKHRKLCLNMKHPLFYCNGDWTRDRLPWDDVDFVYSKRNWETCCSWPCLSYRVLQDGFWKSLPNPTILWFWEMWTGCPGFVASFENCQCGFLYMGHGKYFLAVRFIKLATKTLYQKNLFLKLSHVLHFIKHSFINTEATCTVGEGNPGDLAPDK